MSENLMRIAGEKSAGRDNTGPPGSRDNTHIYGMVRSLCVRSRRRGSGRGSADIAPHLARSRDTAGAVSPDDNVASRYCIVVFHFVLEI
ncbi:hypothetical protein EVAR_24191_1 [Eumeta japonica]|uniref:Uncharacterized protein n=1 Tax=Eumeta variegata TaxID=151549 RepID=A0A4C1W3U6_EUMVA|nr:hypothetical protein EVAR_24191_1 [Eumeta japonica]